MLYGEFARYYDSIYRAQGKDYEREACRLYRFVRRYKCSPGDRLLDVGCGTGEHLRYLQAFFRVEGVDASEDMLMVAREKLPDVPLHRGDMRTFNLEAGFDVVVCLFGSIGYVENWDGLCRAIENMGRHLLPGGVLLIEPWFGPTEIEDGHTHVTVAEGAGCKVVRVGLARVKGRVSEILFHFVVAEREGISAFEERHRLGLFTGSEYKGAMSRCGLEVYFDEEGLSGRGLYIGRRDQL